MHGWDEIALRIGLATMAGVLLGANRWLHHKSAGIKTHALVAIGAAIAVISVAPEFGAGATGTPRNAVGSVLQGLITGIGFLGAGVIIRNANAKRIQGLTTAASIWVTTLIGAAIGMGELVLGLLGVIAVGLVLLVGRSIEQVVGRKFGARHGGVQGDDQP
ncbi:MAG: MgtC/SapB family protein [Rubrivivax sp.]|jgi:putative Mg2+ transporter-C (MgtC) family protein